MEGITGRIRSGIVSSAGSMAWTAGIGVATILEDRFCEMPGDMRKHVEEAQMMKPR